MKQINIFLVITLLILAGCRGNKQSTTDDLIIVDVTKTSYPKKELILQDFMDVEYIKLETVGELLTQGIVAAVGKEYILVKNTGSGGDIYIFDITGKGVRKFNRKGRGPEEYLWIYEVFMDEHNNEIFICDHDLKKIFVYDFYGKFLREIRLREDILFDYFYNYDIDCFICWNSSFEWYNETKSMSSFFIVSKYDGKIIKEIEIPFEQRKSTILISNNIVWRPDYSSIIPFQEQWIFVEPSSDTIYKYLPDHSMLPFLVRTPSIQYMNPEVFLFPGILTDQYYFMEVIKKEADFDKRTSPHSLGLVYDRQQNSIFEYKVYNGDYSIKKEIDMSQRTINNEIAFYQRLYADILIESYEKGELKGKLKEIAAELKEEDNPVLMLVKHKK